MLGYKKPKNRFYICANQKNEKSLPFCVHHGFCPDSGLLYHIPGNCSRGLFCKQKHGRIQINIVKEAFRPLFFHSINRVLYSSICLSGAQYGLEGLLKISLDVVNMFKTNTDPDQVGQHTRLGTLLRIQLFMRG